MKGFQESYLFQSETQFYEQEQELIEITQNLETEQKMFQFPTQEHLAALSYLDEENKYSAFDLFSFPPSPIPTSIVDDDSLSPLQLPTRAIPREDCGPIVNPVNPSTFLSNVTQSCSDCISTESTKTILIRLNKQTMTIVHPSNASDEGYDDTEDDKELESDCQFYTILNDQDIIRDKAAVKIQSVWRGYITRRHHPTPLALQLIGICGTIHRRQMTHFQKRMTELEKGMSKMSRLEKRVAELEKKLKEEVAMRRAFENTVEDMTVLIDHQQKNMLDKLEESESLREYYEQNMDEVSQRTNDLNQKLIQEVNIRNQMENTMMEISDRLHQTETARKKEAETRKAMQTKLDQALNDISQLKSTADIKKKHATTDFPAVRTKTPSRQPITPNKPSVTPTRRTATPTRPTATPTRPTATPTRRTLTTKKISPTKSLAPTTKIITTK
ncbi:unnamed protein product [Rhizopus stolonifer]